MYEGELDAAALRGIAGVSEVSMTDHHMSWKVHGEFEPLLQTLAGAYVVELDSQELSLEEVFLATYGKPGA